jgi:hypothetical protein
VRGLAAFLLALAIGSVTVSANAQDTPPPGYAEAIDLIHAYNGAGEELHRALQIADTLSKTHPGAGYAQALIAEGLSTWRLNHEGEPATVRDAVIRLADEALRLNPELTLAHVAKARALLRSSLYAPAARSIEAALKLDPAESGAIFLRAEIFRRTGSLAEGEAWYRKFIASTRSRTRQSNGYYWLARMYEDAAWEEAAGREALTAKARVAYEQMLVLDPEAPSKNANFAMFLNDHAADFEAAERHAQKALSVAEFPLARYHLAAARYQKLWAQREELDHGRLVLALRRVAVSTGVSLRNAMAFPFSSVVLERLEELQSRLRASSDLSR